jgi:hypothetical protein
MPSTTKPQARLMAACSHGAAYKSCPPLSVAREFNQADKGSGILRKKDGGALRAGFMNFGQGHGRSMTSTMPLMGHALSGTPLGADRGSARKAPHLYSMRFAEGGKVAKPSGPTAKERADIRDMIERGKEDAIDTLRRSRSALLDMMPAAPSTTDYDSALDRLRGNLSMQGGGAVDAADGAQDDESAPQQGDPTAMYQEYMELLEQLQDPRLDSTRQMLLVDRLAEIEKGLEALGIDVSENAGVTSTE